MSFPKSLPIALPSLYAALFLITIVSGDKTARGGNPYFCVSLPFSLPLVAQESTALEMIVGILAAVWWLFIGYIGRSASENKLSRTGAVSGAGLICVMCLVETSLMISEFLLLSREPNFGIIDEAIYTLAVILLIGGLVTAGYSARAAFRRP